MMIYKVPTYLSEIIVALLFLLGFSACEDDFSDPVPEPTILKDFPVIDVHQHIYSASSFWYRESEAGFDYYTTPAVHYETLIQRLKENNVVLSVTGGSLEAVEYYYENYPENRSMFLYSAEYWEIGKATLQITLSYLRKAVNDRQISSIGELCGIYNGVAMDDPTYMALYAMADSCSLPVMIHTGIVPENVYDGYPDYDFEGSNPAHLKPILEMYPDINFNAAHWGSSTHKDFDFIDDVIEMMRMYDNFYVDLGYTLWLNRSSKKISESFIKRAIDEGLENKILYGSDEMIWPDAVTASVNYIKQADYLSDTIKKKILYWNATNFLKLSDEEIATHFKKGG